MAKFLLLMLVLLCALGFALRPEYIAVGVLMFLLGFNAHYVFAVAWRHHRATVRAPRRGMVYLRPRGPQAVRKERQA